MFLQLLVLLLNVMCLWCTMTFYLKIVVPPHMLILTFTQYAPQHLAVPPISDNCCFIPLIITENYCSICIQHFFLNLQFLGKMVVSNPESDREVMIAWQKIVSPRNVTRILSNDSSLMKLIYYLNSIALLYVLL